MGAIYKKEMRSYATGMIGMLYVAFILFLVGYQVSVYCFDNRVTNIPYGLSFILFLYLPSIPVLTMKTFADERAMKTDQLLYSLPVSLYKVVMAKYLAVVTVIAIPFAVFSIVPLIMSMYGDVNFGYSYSFVLAMFLVGCALAAICVFISSLTESQAISAVISIATLIVLYLFETIMAKVPDGALASALLFAAVAVLAAFLVYHLTKNAYVSIAVGVFFIALIVGLYLVDSSMFSGAFEKALQALNVYGRTKEFSSEVLDLKAVVYYLSVIVMFVFFTVQSLEKKRWSEVD